MTAGRELTKLTVAQLGQHGETGPAPWLSHSLLPAWSAMGLGRVLAASELRLLRISFPHSLRVVSHSVERHVPSETAPLASVALFSLLRQCSNVRMECPGSSRLNAATSDPRVLASLQCSAC